MGTFEVEGKLLTGHMGMGNAEGSFRFAQAATETQGPVSVRNWEDYQSALHTMCFDTARNKGFNRLADNHVRVFTSGTDAVPFAKAQLASGLPHRFYSRRKEENPDGIVSYFSAAPAYAHRMQNGEFQG